MVAWFLHEAVQFQTISSSPSELGKKRLCPESPSYSKLSIRKGHFSLLSVGKHCFLAFRALQGNSNVEICSNNTIQCFDYMPHKGKPKLPIFVLW